MVDIGQASQSRGDTSTLPENLPDVGITTAIYRKLKYNSLSVQQGLGGGRCAVPSRHGQKGGGRRGGWDGSHGGGLLLQRDDHGGGVGFRDAEPLRQGREGAGGGIAKGAECCK